MRIRCSALIAAVAMFLVCASIVVAEDFRQEIVDYNQVYKGTDYYMPYLLYNPPGTLATDPLPLMIFLHGSGERYGDMETLRTANGVPPLIEAGKDFPCRVVSPKWFYANGGYWREEMISVFLDDLLAVYPTNTNRIYITGLSMGGGGAWESAALRPEMYAALLPISSVATYPEPAYFGDRLTDTPVWAFHGADDPYQAVTHDTDLIDALIAAGSTTAQMTIYPGVGHDAWTQTYARDDVWDWMFSQTLGVRLPCDLDNNGLVGFGDFLILQQAWGTSEPAADINGNGVVDFADFLEMQQTWGETDATGLPEPATAALLAAGAMGLLRRRR